MALASWRKVGDKIGSGRFVVSEGVAPSAYLLPHEDLPTIGLDSEDDRFEVLIAKGAILSAVKDANGHTRLVPCGYTGTLTGTDTTNINRPIGCAQYNLLRPFDRGTSQGAGWITHGYVEWPLISTVNDNLLPGDLVISGTGTTAGVPVKGYVTDPDGAGPLAANVDAGNVVGRVIETEWMGGGAGKAQFDDGLLAYMRLTGDAEHMSDPLFNVTEPGPHQGHAGVRVNLDVPNVVGAVRVALTI